MVVGQPLPKSTTPCLNMGGMDHGFMHIAVDQLSKRQAQLLIMIVSSLVGATFFYFAAHLYIPLLLGEDFRSSIPIASLIGVAVYIKLLNYFLQTRDVVFETIRRHQLKVVIYRVSYILMLFVLIKKYEVCGVVATIIMSELVYLVMLYFDFYRSQRREGV